MRKIFLFTVSILLSISIRAQSFQEQIEQHRANYKKEFLKDKRSPLNKRDLKYLRFYKPDSSYKLTAIVTRVTDTMGFDMQTHNGVIKRYFIYGYARFELHGIKQKLFIYQSEKLRVMEGFEDYLFIPFTDETNYKETFGGGRYLDFRMNDIEQVLMTIDFNTCYNPYCAFKEGYACPIPPKENDMNLSIEAGEKLFGKEVKEK